GKRLAHHPDMAGECRPRIAEERRADLFGEFGQRHILGKHLPIAIFKMMHHHPAPLSLMLCPRQRQRQPARPVPTAVIPDLIRDPVTGSEPALSRLQAQKPPSLWWEKG